MKINEIRGAEKDNEEVVFLYVDRVAEDPQQGSSLFA